MPQTSPHFTGLSQNSVKTLHHQIVITERTTATERNDVAEIIVQLCHTCNNLFLWWKVFSVLEVEIPNGSRQGEIT